MKVIAFIESCQRDVIDRILRHLGLRPQSRPRPDPRAPPPSSGEAGGPRPAHEPDGAVPLAAVLSSAFRALDGLERVGVVLSGGNASLDRLPWR